MAFWGEKNSESPEVFGNELRPATLQLSQAGHHYSCSIYHLAGKKVESSSLWIASMVKNIIRINFETDDDGGATFVHYLHFTHLMLVGKGG